MAPKGKTATVAEFDKLKAKLVKRLREFWDDQTSPIAAPVLKVKSLAAMRDDVPELDSKAVQRASPIIEDLLGFQLTSAFLKRGGHESFDDLIDHLMPLLRDTCAGKKVGPAKAKATTPTSLAARSKKK